MSAEIIEDDGAGTPEITIEPPVLVEPSSEPVVVTASYPAGEDLASISQMLVGATELCLWQDVAELIRVRSMIHEVACHLDHLTPNGSDVTITISAAPGKLEVELNGPSRQSELPTWLLAELRDVFDRIELTRDDAGLTLTLGCSWEARSIR